MAVEEYQHRSGASASCNGSNNGTRVTWSTKDQGLVPLVLYA